MTNLQTIIEGRYYLFFLYKNASIDGMVKALAVELYENLKTISLPNT